MKPTKTLSRERHALPPLLAAALLSASLFGQAPIPLPPEAYVHVATFLQSTQPTSYSAKGFWFEMPANGVPFDITGLRVVGGGSFSTQQRVQVRAFSSSPPSGPGTVLFDTNTFVTTGLVPCQVPVDAGDVIAILGVEYDFMLPVHAFRSSIGSGGFASNAYGNQITLNACETFGMSSIASVSTSLLGLGRIVVNVDAPSEMPTRLSGTVEATAGAGVLSTASLQPFGTGDYLRWQVTSNPSDPTPPSICAVVANLGGWNLATGATAGLPGFEQLSVLSTPVGQEFILPPFLVGGSHSLQVPAGFFGFGDQLRIQALALEPSLAPLPALASTQVLSFHNIENLPFLATEDFEGIPTGAGSFPSGWADGGGTQMWSANSGSTASSGTGPSGASSGSNYLYCETSSPATTNDTYVLNSPVYSATGVTGIAFDLSRVGAAIGTLQVRIGDGNNTFPTTVQTFTGPSSGSNEWGLAVVPLSGLGSNFQVQFQYTRGTSFTGDLAIDHFRVY